MRHDAGGMTPVSFLMVFGWDKGNMDETAVSQGVSFGLGLLKIK